MTSQYVIRYVVGSCLSAFLHDENGRQTLTHYMFEDESMDWE